MTRHVFTLDLDTPLVEVFIFHYTHHLGGTLLERRAMLTSAIGAVASDTSIITRDFFLLVAPEHISARGELTSKDREAVISLSPRLRALGLPPYALLHGRDPSAVAVMMALRARGTAPLEGAATLDPLPLPERMNACWDLNNLLKPIESPDASECAKVRDAMTSTVRLNDGVTNAWSLLVITPHPVQLLIALDVDSSALADIKPLHVVRATLDFDGRAHSAKNLCSLE